MEYCGAHQCLGWCSFLKWWSGTGHFHPFHEPALVYGSVSDCLLTWVNASIVRTFATKNSHSWGWMATHRSDNVQERNMTSLYDPFHHLALMENSKSCNDSASFQWALDPKPLRYSSALSFSILTIQVRASSIPHLSCTTCFHPCSLWSILHLQLKWVIRNMGKIITLLLCLKYPDGFPSG